MTSITKKNKANNRDIIIKILIGVFWIGIWQLVASIINEEILLPGPYTTLLSIISLIKSSHTYVVMAYTMGEIMLWISIGTLLAILCAAFASGNKIWEMFISPVVAMMKSVPVACFIVIILVMFSSEAATGIIAFMVVFPITYNSVLKAILNIDSKIFEMFKIYRVRKLKAVTYLYLPCIISELRVIFKTSIGMAIKAGIAAQLIGVTKNSIGEVIYLSKLYLNMDELLAWTLLIIVMCYIMEKITDKILSMIQKRTYGI